jgi:hypothetical protein
MIFAAIEILEGEGTTIVWFNPQRVRMVFEEKGKVFIQTDDGDFHVATIPLSQVIQAFNFALMSGVE